MQTEQGLLEQFKKENINLYRLADFIEVENKIKLDGIEELIRFAHDNNINNILYFYYYIDGCQLIIDEEIIKTFHIDNEMLSLIKEEIMEYNTKIAESDYSEPVGVKIYCMYNGIVLEVDDKNSVAEINIDAPEDVLTSIIERHLEEIKLHKKEKLDNIQEQRKELLEKILSDKEFHKCTNKDLRRLYGDRVIRNNPEYKKLFLNEGRWYDISINDFIEILWRDYKDTSKKTIITTLRKEDLI